MAAMKTSVDFEMVNNSSNEKKTNEVDSQFVLHSKTPVVELNVADAFEGLSQKEKLYAHYFSKASWYGSLICLFQASPESPLIFSLVLKVFGSEPLENLQKQALQNGVTEDQFQALVVYACGILSNLANYKGFGDTKFVPGAPPEAFEALIRASEAFRKDRAKVEALWGKVKASVYSLSEREKTLGFPKSGVTTFLSSNCSEQDTQFINKFLSQNGMEAYNTRAFKSQKDGKNYYEIRLASELRDSNGVGLHLGPHQFEGAVFAVTRGDYAPLLRLVADCLERAKGYAANETQVAMIEKYIESFRTGSLDAHKQGSRLWVKDKGPVVETYIGFIETYRDPAGVRADFTGWVAVVNKERSANFLSLVQSAESIISDLPWHRTFEKDKFLQPDFTSLDVLTFAHSGVPFGINIPNYDSIRQNEGYKNVFLGNVVLSSLNNDKMQFLTSEDEKLLLEFRKKSFDVHVALHELLGHGTGKLFVKEQNGKFNFDIDSVKSLFPGQEISWYEAGETYDSKFGEISSSYEECRAEAVGLYLCSHPKVLKIFGYEGKEAEDIVYVNWLSMMWNVIATGPESYSFEKGCWLQAHARARFVLFRVLEEAGVVKVEETEPGENLLVSLERQKIATEGKKAIGEFLRLLQIYKSMGDVGNGGKLYEKYSKVPREGSPWANWRSIAFKHMKPRRMYVQANTEISGSDVVLKRYDATFSGILESWTERFSKDAADIHEIIENLWPEDQKHFIS